MGKRIEAPACLYTTGEIGKVRKALEANQEKEQKYESLANDLDVSKKDILEMEQRMASRDLSLDAHIDDNQELTHFDLLKETSPNQEEVLGEEEEKKILEKDCPGCNETIE